MKKIFGLYRKYNEIVNYIIIGVLTTIISLAVYYILTFTILNPNNPFQLQVANITSWIISVLFAYFTNRKYVFKSKNKKVKLELLKFFSSRLFTLAFDMVFMYIFVSAFHFNDRLMKILSNIVVIILNYVFSKLFVFNIKSEKINSEEGLHHERE